MKAFILLMLAFFQGHVFADSDWQFEMANRNEGPTITFKGNKFSMGTSFVCVEKSWKTQYFWLAKFPFKTQKTESSLLLTSDPEHPTDFYVDAFRFESVSGTQIRLVIDGTLKEDREAMIEYIPLAIPALFMEEARVENEGGAAITVGASTSEINVESKRLTIRSKIGTIVIEAVKGPGFKMVDRRAKPYKGREIFIFSVATAPSIAKGERFYHEMTLTTSGDFKSFAELPVLTPVGGSVRIRQSEKIQPSPLAKEIFPKPKNASLGGGTVRLPDSLAVAADSPEKSERFASLLTELFAATSTPRTAKADPKGWISVKSVAAPKTNAFDYYELSVTKNGVTIGASTDAAVYYALSTLVQLSDGVGSLRLAEVKDWADFRFRAIHILADDYSLPLHSLFISNVFGPLRINHLMLECEYVKWPSHPEMHQSWGMTPEDLRSLIRLANEHFIEVSPVFQTYGHCEYLFKDKNNLEIAEDTGVPYAYNVSNPRTYEIIGDLFTDLRKVFSKPAFLHIGHDEITIRGKYPSRPENLKFSLAELLWKDLVYYESYAKKESLSLMLWQDYLNGRSHPEHRDSLLGVAKKMDKSAVIAVWDYRPALEFPEVDEFQNLGFRVVGATGEEDIANLVNFSRYGKKKNIYGMLHTTWTGYSGNSQSMFRYAKKMWPYVQAGVSFWSAEAPAVDYYTPSYAARMFSRVISGMYPRRYFPMGDENATPLDLSALADSSLAESGGFAAGNLRTDYGTPFFLAGDKTAAGITVTADKPIILAVGKRVKAISFLYTSLSADVAMKQVGEIKIEGEMPFTQPIVIRREIGNIVQKLLIPGDVENGKVLTKASRDEIYSVSQPVYSANGKNVLWQYDLATGGVLVHSIIVSAAKNAGLLLAAVTLVE